MAVPNYTYSGVCYTATASQTTFALTTSGGESIGYLKQEHIKVRTSADGGDTWTGLSLNTDWVFADPATSIVLNTGAAAGLLVDIYRETPMDDDYIDFQAGSLLTAEQLNTFDTWQLYIDQELADKTANISSTLPSSFVSQIVEGSNITLSPADGKGVVTINGQGTGGGGPTNTDGLPEGQTNLYYTDARVETYVDGAGYVKGPVVSKLVAGTNIVLTPSSGEGIVTIQSVGGSAVNYLGLIDAVNDAAPAGPRNGDMYVNTGSGVAGATWLGVAGDSLVGNERLIWDTGNNEWGLIRDLGIPEAPADGQLYARKDQAWSQFALPAAQVQSNWNEVDTNNVAFIQNKPTIPAAQVQSDWNEVDTNNVAFIKNKPSIAGSQNLQQVCDQGNVTTTKIQAAGYLINQLPTLP